jgi:hypothetical protein
MTDLVNDLQLRVLLGPMAPMLIEFEVEVKKVCSSQEAVVLVGALVADQISSFFPSTVIESHCQK